MSDAGVVDEAGQEARLVLGKPRAFWTARRTAALMGLAFGVPTGVLSAALLIWSVPAGHWVRDSWVLVGAGYAAIMTIIWIPLSLFLWWINHGIKRKY